MQIIRQIYDDLPGLISVPMDFQHHKAEVIILSLDTDTHDSSNIPLMNLAGCLKKSSLASDSPQNLQKKLRHEWH